MQTPKYISAFVVSRNKNQNQYLLLRRCSKHLFGNWQVVTGKVEENETSYGAAYREIQEETGLAPERLYSADAVETFYEIGKDCVMFVPAFVGFIDELRAVKLNPREHDMHQWTSYSEAMNILEFDNQRRILQHIESTFGNLESKSRFLIPKDKLKLITS